LVMSVLSFMTLHWKLSLVVIIILLLIILIWRGAVEAKELNLSEGELKLAPWPPTLHG
jgi:hypothetical protein